MDDGRMDGCIDERDHRAGADDLRLLPMAPTMAAALADFHARLSADTIRNRFFTPHPELSPDELRRFTTVDHRDRDAFVLVDGQDIVAVARLDRLAPGGTAAEVAFVVADSFQHRGLGALLLAALVERARQLGITRLEADTLTTNIAMQAIFRHAGLPVTTSLDHGVVHVTIEVAPPS